MNRHLRTFLVAPLCALLAADAFGQWPGSWNPSPQPDNVVAWPLPPGAYTRVRLGDLTGDGLNDACVVVGGRAAMLYRPAFHSAVVQVDWTVTANDVAVVPPLTLGQPGSVALVSAAGVRMYTLDPASAFVGGPLDTSWQSVTVVHAADLDGLGPWDLIGARGATVLTLLDDGTGQGQEAGVSFTALGTVLDVLTPDWNGDGDLDIALLTTRGVEIHDNDGSFVEESTGWYPGDTLSVVNHGAAADELLWITTTPSGAQVMLNLAPGGTRTNCGILNGNGVVGSAAADIEIDGDFELVTTETDTHVAMLFANTKDTNPTGPPFAKPPSSIFQAGPLVPAPNNQADPGFLDLTGDGIPDLLFPVHALGAFQFFIGPNGPALPPPHDSPSGADAWLCPRIEPGSPPTLKIGLDLPPAHGYNAVEATLWRLIAGTQYLEDEAKFHAVYGIATNPPAATCPGTTDVELDMPVSENHCAFTNEYYLEVRLVDWLGGQNGSIQNFGPEIHAGFVLDEGKSYDMAQTSPWGIVLDIDVDDGCPDDGTPAPGFVPGPRIPSFLPGTVPNPGEIVCSLCPQ